MNWPKYPDYADYAHYAEYADYVDYVDQPNIPNQNDQTKPNLARQAYWTKQTKPYPPKLLVKAVITWVRSAFDNVFDHSWFSFTASPNVLRKLTHLKS